MTKRYNNSAENKKQIRRKTGGEKRVETRKVTGRKCIDSLRKSETRTNRLRSRDCWVGESDNLSTQRAVEGLQRSFVVGQQRG